MSSSSAEFQPLFGDRGDERRFTPLRSAPPPARFRPLYDGGTEPAAPGPQPAAEPPTAPDPPADAAEVDRAATADPTAESPPPAPTPVVEPEDLDGTLLRLHDEAREAGRRAGLEEGHAAAAETVAAAATLLDELQGLRRRVLERSVRDVAATAVDVARCIVARELAVGGADVHRVVAEVLDALGDQDELVVLIAPEDDDALRDAYPALLARVGRDTTLRVEASAGIGRGGVKVETLHGSVDATVEARFEAFAEAIDAWATERAEGLDG